MIRAGVVGLGWWGRHIVRRMAGSDVLKVVAVADSNPERAAFAAEHGLAFTGDLSGLLADKDIDAVILATPHALHTQQVLSVAAAGKHVFCEKPLALTRADAQLSVEACRKAGVMLGIGHERRFETAMDELRKLIRAGALGEIMHVEANFSHDILASVPQDDWRASPSSAPAAGMTAMGVHLTDLFLDLVGPVSEVHAVTTSRVAYRQTGDVVSVVLRFASGATGYLNAILVTPLYLRFTVFGSKAWVEIRNHTHPDTQGRTTLTLQRSGQEPEIREIGWVDAVRANLEAFARSVKGEADYPFTDEQKIGNVAILEAICRSVAANNPVKVQ